VALDAKTGKIIWSSTNGDPSKGQTGTSAPMVVKDKVLIGISGGEFGVQCHMTAYDLKTGTRVWRAYSEGSDDQIMVDPENTTELGKPVGKQSSLKTWEGDQWRIGGGCTWGWISYDPELNLVYYGSGNPSPWNSNQRPGDNKWSMTIWARDPDTGIAKWVYQMSPHDEWGFDGVNEMILSDQQIKGSLRKLLTHFDRNGIGYTLDRATGELLAADKYDLVNWTSGIDMNKSSKTYGRPLVIDAYSTQHAGEDTDLKGICPSTLGAKNEQPAAYSPNTQLFYVPTSHLCMDYEPFKVCYTAGQPYIGAHLSTYPPKGDSNMGSFIAWDGKSGKIVWSEAEQLPAWGGALATAGGVVFYGTLEGYLKAVDAKTGKELYKFKTPSGIIGNVTTYEHGGRQFVAVLSGVGGGAGIALTASLTDPSAGLGAVGGYASLANYTTLGGSLTVFALPVDTVGPIANDVKAFQPVYFATNREIKDPAQVETSSFTAERSLKLKYGLAVVSVPKNHKTGNVEWPSFNYFRWSYNKETDRDHFRVRLLSLLSRDRFVDDLRSNSDSVLLFVHGYDMPFEDSIFKAAQIAYDAGFGGSVLVFAWPSAGALYKYDYDRESAHFSVGDLLIILRILTEEIGDERIYVVAHSLGNQVLVDALQQAALSRAKLHITELVMAAPDVDKDVFLKKAEQIRSVAKNMTIYASSADKALLASDKKAWGTRMGYIGAGGPNLVEGVETIDVTAVGEDMFGLDHSTYSTSRVVLDDLGRLITSMSHQSPNVRSPILKSMPDKEHVKYWLYPP
jgi:lanthanide-dependent methanol dehydrogenase